MNKLFSGRYLITVAAAIVFMYCSFRGVLQPMDIKEIIRDVIVFYFVVKSATDKSKGGAV